MNFSDAQKYGLVFLSLACAVTGVLWRQRETSNVHAEDVAELRSATVERGLALHVGTNAWTGADWLTITSNRVVVTFGAPYPNGVLRLTAGTNLIFDSSNWDSWQSVSFESRTMYPPIPVSDEVPVLVDGIDDGAARFRVGIVTNGTSSATNAQQVFTAVTVKPFIYRLLYGDTGSTQIKLNYDPGTVTNIAAAGVVDEYMRWETIYERVLDEARDLAISEPTAYTPQIMWLATRDSLDGASILDTDAAWTSTVSIVTGDAVPDMTVRQWSLTEAIGTNCTETLPMSTTRWTNGVYRTIYPSTNYPERVTPVCLQLAGSTAGALGFDWADGSWWTRIGLGTNVYAYACESTSNGVLSVDQWIDATLLDQAAAVITNLQRTVRIVGPSEFDDFLICTNVGYFGGHAFASDAAFSDGGLPPLPFRSELDQDWSSFSTNSTLTGFLYDDACLLYQNGDGSGFWQSTYTNNTPAEDIVWQGEWYTAYDAECYALRNCRLQYPSHHALTNGYVSRVAVYMVTSMGFTSTRMPAGGQYWNYGYACTAFSASGGSMNPAAVTDLSAGLFPTNSWDEYSGASEYGQNAQDVFNADSSAFRLKHMRVLKIGEWEDPLTSPEFTIGLESAPAFSSTAFAECAYTLLDYDAPMDSYSEVHAWAANGSWNVCLRFLVIVVDWKWRHLNAAAPYIPDPYTPAWVTNSAQ